MPLILDTLRAVFLTLLWAVLSCIASPARSQDSGTEPVDRAQAFVDFNTTPPRRYQPCPGATTVFYEAESGAEIASLSAMACQKFLKHLDFVLNRLPPHARGSYSTTHFFLMLGEKSAQGGHKSGMRFVSRGSRMADRGYDLRWEDGIVVYSTTNLMYLTDLWTRKAILHEMAHAWHLRNWPAQHPPLLQAWRKAVAAGRYRNVQDVNGKTIASAYATANHLEYFAELSAAYFVGINYQPYDRTGLSVYDPLGHDTVEDLWGIR
jgi:hypothetical protein